MGVELLLKYLGLLSLIIQISQTQTPPQLAGGFDSVFCFVPFLSRLDFLSEDESGLFPMSDKF